MLYTATKLIFETIKNDKNSKTLLETYQNKILASNVLKLEFELLEDVKKAEGKLTLSEANRFVKHLNEKYSEKIKSIKYEVKSKKDLLESFGISNLNPHVLDNLISYDNKSLNESAIVSFVHSKENLNLKEALTENKNHYKNVYNNIIRQNDRAGFKRQLSLIEGYAHALSENHKIMITESIKSINEQSTKNFKSSVNNAFKLKLFTEGLFKQSNHLLFEADIDYDAMERELDNEFKGKTISLGQVAKFEKVKIESTLKQDGVFVLTFNLKVYPTDSSRIVRYNELNELRNKLLKSKTVLVNKLIYQAGYDYFTFDGTKFDVSLNAVVEDKDIVKTGGATTAKFELIKFIKEVLSLEELKHDFQVILNNYSEFLDTYIPDNLNNELLMQNIEDSKGAKRKNRKRNQVEKETDSIIDNDSDIGFAIGDGSNYFDRFR